jgi:taurine--2-oxoglutarate transaminase
MSELTGKEVQELDLQYVLHSWSKQAEKMAYIAPGYASEPKSRLAKMLVDIAGGNMRKVFFTNAGAEANENAIKMACAVSGRAKIFSRYRSYHGATMGAGNASGDPRRFVLEQGGNAQGFVKFFDPYLYQERVRFESEEEATAYYLGMLRDQVIYENPYNVAAIVIETITGANGVIIPPKGYLEGVRRLCDEFGIFMICDEVMAGFGRTGKMFAYKNYDFEPDIIVFAKGVTCGYVPLGGVIVSERIAILTTTCFSAG